MSDDPRIQQLLDELYDQQATPEEVCRSCPELLPMVRSRWLQICRVRANLDMLFPPSDAPTLRAPEQLALPQIPGYEVETVLGRGGMGIVFRARHLRLNRIVALKMLLVGAYAGPKERGRLVREAEAVAGLRHANIVQVHDLGEHDGRPYFTMEYVEGGSLAQKLIGTPQSVREGAALVATLAQAVHVAHQGGIVHRDLKPANVLLTTDGTPKISDFGLARRLEGAKGITQSGVAIGTPSYMAPEQAQGQTHAIGPAVDVYALGAILYELVTGRPPFKGETAAATLQQMVTQDPVSPSRLNLSVPRDLETICLKCLHKEPQRRYASASALADDLKRWAEGRPILARPASWGERGWRWGRRNPAMAALMATALALVGLASGGGVWLVRQQAERRAEAFQRDWDLRNGVNTDVTQAESLRKRFHFQEARALLNQARQLVEPAGSDDLRRQVNQAWADLELVEKLDTARMRTATPVEGKFKVAGAEPLYEEAFERAGLGQPGDDGEVVAARVRDSAVRAETVAALDDWAWITEDPARRAWLLTVARRADPDPVRDRLRQPELWRNGPALTKLVQETRLVEKVRVDDLSPQFLTTLGRALRFSGGDAVPLLRAAQARFPQDFWLNHQLGMALKPSNQLDEALTYLRMAAALRPDVGLVHMNLGVALTRKGRLDEATDQFQEALRIDPNAFAGVHVNLGTVLSNLGRVDEAMSHYQEALRFDPRDSLALANLGVALSSKGRLDEAIHSFEESIRLDPGKSGFSHWRLGIALQEKGRWEQAIGHFQQAIELDPNSAMVGSDFFNCLFASACAAVQATTDKDSRRLDEKERAGLRRQALERLKAGLELRTRLLKDGKEASWICSLFPWQTDPALAGVRDREALAKLIDAEREQWQRLWAEVAALLPTDPRGQGTAFAARREWNTAADCYSRALLGATDDGHFWFEYAALLLLSGDHPGYIKACAHLVDRCGKDKEPRPYHVARVCTLAPDAVAEASLPGRLAEPELRASPQAFWSLTEQGALAYRAGRFQQSVTFFEESLRANTKPGAALLNWLWLALANQRLGKAEEARRWLGKAQSWLDQYSGGMPAHAEEDLGLHFHNWLEAHVLRREAEAQMQPRGSPSGPENGERGVRQK